VILREGTHFLRETLEVGPGLGGLDLASLPNESAWLSGGVRLRGVSWRPSSGHTLVANLSDFVREHGIRDITGLFTYSPHRRLTRARFPNADVERERNSLDGFQARQPVATEWWRPPAGKAPTFTSVDLQAANPSGHFKNNSAMREYNTYVTGRGGVCESVWGTASSYWCSNASAGGWAEVDAEAARSGRLNIPNGMTYNKTALPNVALWGEAAGAVVHAKHSQTWAMHMFEVSSHDESKGRLTFGRGGWQGGRNWCRCDQCTYAGPWCNLTGDSRIIGGDWYVEGVREELDSPGEFYFDNATKMLYFWPNGTDEADLDLVVPRLKTLVHVKGTSASPVANVSIRGVGFRDSAKTYMEQWGVPSGGDWALYRGGAVMVEGAVDVSIERCKFHRLDTNAVFIAGFVRGASVLNSSFAWLGENAIATWGDTNEWDAREGLFPIGTRIEGNVMRELGLYQIQSSALGQAKAAKTVVKRNVMFNMPRAAINFNDHLGGGNLVESNLIWNTCRESGDHGPINTWDRLPYLNPLTGTFDSVPSHVRGNFIIANYGASQGVDNDDGSSWWRIHDNVFYSADGFKMDYGGHDSAFYRNLVVTQLGGYDGGNCFHLGSFLPGHGDSFVNNTCVVLPAPGLKGSVIGQLDQCDAALLRFAGNRYYTQAGNATVKCGRRLVPLQHLPAGLEAGSSSSTLPAAPAIIEWARSLLDLAAPAESEARGPRRRPPQLFV